MGHITRNVLWPESQCWFRKGRTCALQLLDDLHKWFKAIDVGKSIDVAYLDFRRAFDSVLVKRSKKIQIFDVTGSVLNWIGEFVQNRRKRVVINDLSWTLKTVLSDVPQESVLGPILFLIFFNDMPHTVANTVHLFADDKKVSMRHQDPVPDFPEGFRQPRRMGTTVET